MLPRKASTRDAVETAIEKARDPKAKWTWLDA